MFSLLLALEWEEGHGSELCKNLRVPSLLDGGWVLIVPFEVFGWTLFPALSFTAACTVPWATLFEVTYHALAAHHPQRFFFFFLFNFVNGSAW